MFNNTTVGISNKEGWNEIKKKFFNSNYETVKEFVDKELPLSKKEKTFLLNQTDCFHGWDNAKNMSKAFLLRNQIEEKLGITPKEEELNNNIK